MYFYGLVIFGEPLNGGCSEANLQGGLSTNNPDRSGDQETN